MPIYEYQCKACGHTLEVFQKGNEALETQCPKCHKPDLQKLISASGFQLKGTGWYATDFKDKGKAKVKNDETADTKAETKPADAANKSAETAPTSSTKDSTEK